MFAIPMLLGFVATLARLEGGIQGADYLNEDFDEVRGDFVRTVSRPYLSLPIRSSRRRNRFGIEGAIDLGLPP